MIEIEGYLIQRKLEETMREIVGEKNWLGREVKVPETRMRWDMMFKVHNEIFVVEFDGDAHYTKALPQIKNDMRKDKIAKDLNYKTIRFPYWVQLTSETLLHYFGLDNKIKQDFPHGFISDKAMLPSSYCELGVEKFKKEFNNLPLVVQNDIVESLKVKIKKFEKEFVLPKSLYFLINE